MDHAAIIDSLGADKIAEATGEPIAHVRVWKSRGKIPGWAYADIIVSFKEVTLAQLKAGARAGRATA